MKWFFLSIITSFGLAGSVNSQCKPISAFPWAEGFEVNDTLIPACWEQEIVGDPTWAWAVVPASIGTPATALKGKNKMQLFLDFGGLPVYTAKLISPVFDLTAVTKPVLKFWHTQTGKGHLVVYYKNVQNGEWVLLKSFFTSEVGEIPDWQEEIIALPEVSDYYQIAFDGIFLGGGVADIQLDAVSISDEEDSKDGFLNAFDADSVLWRSCLEFNISGFENPIIETVLSGDTTINGVKWKILNQSWGSKGLLRTEDAKVIFFPYPGFEVYWERLIEEETTVYDFSLDVGDSFNFVGLFGTVTVIATDSIVLNYGRKHKKLFFSNPLLNCIEGLGSDLFHPFFFLTRGMTTSMPNFATFMCCHVNGELLYMNPAFLDCEGNRVSNEMIGKPAPKSTIVFDNGRLRVTRDDDALFDVAVYHMQGKLLAQAKNNRNEWLVHLEHLPKGVYIVRISSENVAYSEKIVR